MASVAIHDRDFLSGEREENGHEKEKGGSVDGLQARGVGRRSQASEKQRILEAAPADEEGEGDATAGGTQDRRGEKGAAGAEVEGTREHHSLVQAVRAAACLAGGTETIFPGRSLFLYLTPVPPSENLTVNFLFVSCIPFDSTNLVLVFYCTVMKFASCE